MYLVVISLELIFFKKNTDRIVNKNKIWFIWVGVYHSCMAGTSALFDIMCWEAEHRDLPLLQKLFTSSLDLGFVYFKV